MIFRATRYLGHVLLVALVGAGLTFITGDSGFQEPAARTTLELLPGAQHLSTGYRLPVAEVPEPPADVSLMPGESAPSSGCPVQVRAIVHGGDTPFAMVGVGDESTLMRVGSKLKTSIGFVSITKIRSDHIMVRHGATIHRCALSSSTR